MASWDEVRAAVPEFAETGRALFDAHRHKTLATLRRDGSPRISGIEAVFVGGELLWFGGWADSRKVRDLLRDPRFALHGPTKDPDGWRGGAKLAGRAVEVTDPAVIAAATGGRARPGRPGCTPSSAPT